MKDERRKINSDVATESTETTEDAQIDFSVFSVISVAPSDSSYILPGGVLPMINAAHLWAFGYDDMERAEQVRAEAMKLGERHCLIVLDTAVAVRHPDGSVTLEGEPLVSAPKLGRRTLASFLAGLALGAPPLTRSAVGALMTSTAGVSPSQAVGIDEQFIRQVAALMKPGTSTLFLLDQVGEMSAILQGIRGLGGTVMKTNVDLERARLIQSTLATAAT
jgi:uncharacterized membrane protein